MWLMRGRRSVAARRRTLAAGTVAMVLSLAACGSSRPGSSSSTVTTRTSTPAALGVIPSCRPSQLAVAYAGTQGATGHMEVTLALRNVSTSACRLRGYAEARLLDSTGRALPMRARRGHGFFPDTLRAPRFVSLSPGSRARFGISFVTNSEYAHAHVCRTAVAAMAAPPGAAGRWERVSLRPAPRISPCGDLLVLSPVHT
jgi:hypothetical protein